ncbi:MAG TPA: glycosyltransferase [Vicinamibacterales bacterium]|nr:glycosyltransferase [Vicinamibacterales bacterium]
MTVRRRVSFVLPSLNGGGAERAAVQVLNGLSADKWDRSMFLFERTGPYLADLDPSIALSASPSPSRGERWQALRRFVKESEPHVVVAFLSFATTLSAARAAQTGARVVFNQQTPMTAFLGDADYEWRHGWRRTVFTATSRLTYSAADLIVATSNGVAEDLTKNFGVNPDAIQVVPNPVDLDAVRARAGEAVEIDRDRDTPVIVAAGRLADAKNYPLLIDAIAVLRRTLPARLLILGQGELEQSLRRHIADRQLEGAITLLGFQRNPWKYIARADVFALSSHYEGFGNVLIEAMAVGVPVVATASAGTRDIIHHGVDGLLVEQHDAESLAAALVDVLSSPDRRRAMSNEARVAAERFAAPRVIARYDAVLEQVAA